MGCGWRCGVVCFVCFDEALAWVGGVGGVMVGSGSLPDGEVKRILGKEDENLVSEKLIPYQVDVRISQNLVTSILLHAWMEFAGVGPRVWVH